MQLKQSIASLSQHNNPTIFNKNSLDQHMMNITQKQPQNCSLISVENRSPSSVRLTPGSLSYSEILQQSEVNNDDISLRSDCSFLSRSVENSSQASPSQDSEKSDFLDLKKVLTSIT